MNQTREYVFRNCPEWKTQQKIPWAEVRNGSGRMKNRSKIRREEERRQEAEVLGAGENEERALFLPTPSFVTSAKEK